MAEEVVKVTEVAETPAPVKKQRKPREKVRDMKELMELPVNKLSDKEKDVLIKELKETATILQQKAEAYKQNASSAFDQTRQIEEQYKAMENYYRGLLSYVNNQVNAFKAAIDQAIKGGIA